MLDDPLVGLLKSQNCLGWSLLHKPLPHRVLRSKESQPVNNRLHILFSGSSLPWHLTGSICCLVHKGTVPQRPYYMALAIRGQPRIHSSPCSESLSLSPGMWPDSNYNHVSRSWTPEFPIDIRFSMGSRFPGASGQPTVVCKWGQWGRNRRPSW